jgi:hypothetical protein
MSEAVLAWCWASILRRGGNAGCDVAFESII